MFLTTPKHEILRGRSFNLTTRERSAMAVTTGRRDLGEDGVGKEVYARLWLAAFILRGGNDDTTDSDTAARLHHRVGQPMPKHAAIKSEATLRSFPSNQIKRASKLAARQAGRQANQPTQCKAARPEAAMGFSRTKLLPRALITYHHRRQPEPRLHGSLLRGPESVESFRRVGDCQLRAPAPALTASGVSNGRVLKWNGQARGWSTYADGPGYKRQRGRAPRLGFGRRTHREQVRPSAGPAVPLQLRPVVNLDFRKGMPWYFFPLAIRYNPYIIR